MRLFGLVLGRMVMIGRWRMQRTRLTALATNTQKGFATRRVWRSMVTTGRAVVTVRRAATVRGVRRANTIRGNVNNEVEFWSTTQNTPFMKWEGEGEW